ncbi:MAG: hypothetical protein EB165_07670, partial [Euryarchaeota archaeon]|nr:hypothetical protein [Euryarchaeota archaeon]NDB94498.1 hypothetical protein [Euryarchaeota archaeon]
SDEYPMLDCSEYIHTGWKSDCYMGDKPEDAQAILMCEFSIVSNHGMDISQLSYEERDRLPFKYYYPLPKPVPDEELFALLSLRLDTIPSWYPSWWNNLEDTTLEPPHYKEERMMSFGELHNNREEILERRTHKEVMELHMIDAWLFSMSGDMFGGSIECRTFNCTDLAQGMPGGNSRSFWALKEPTPLTKGDAA